MMSHSVSGDKTDKLSVDNEDSARVSLKGLASISAN